MHPKNNSKSIKNIIDFLMDFGTHFGTQNAPKMTPKIYKKKTKKKQLFSYEFYSMFCKDFWVPWASKIQPKLYIFWLRAQKPKPQSDSALPSRIAL